MADTRMRNTLHANLGPGGYRYEYENEDGDRCTIVREPRQSSERQFWTHDEMPEREFASYEESKAERALLTSEAIASEAARYPRITELEPDTCGNACRLCPRVPGGTPIGVKHDTWRVHILTTWQKWHHASICHAHRDQFANDAAGLVAAIEAEIAERRARWQASELRRAAERARVDHA